MTQETNRRYLDRCEIPGAEIIYRTQGTKKFFAKYHGPAVIRNLSKSGVCFESLQELNPGDQIELKILIPGERNIKLKGKIVWSSFLESQKRPLSGMQFLPFGASRKYNPMVSLSRLRNITENYN